MYDSVQLLIVQLLLTFRNLYSSDSGRRQTYCPVFL